MSLKKVDEVKKDRGFKILDLIIYGAVILTVAVLFIVIFTTRDADPLSGVKISVKAEVVFEYTFGGTPEYSPENVEVEEDGEGITVTVRSAEGDLNVVYIDKTLKSVKVTEANCKGKECMYFEPMTNNSQLVYCSPHGLKIEPLTEVYDDPDLIM